MPPREENNTTPLDNKIPNQNSPLPDSLKVTYPNSTPETKPEVTTLETKPVEKTLDNTPPVITQKVDENIPKSEAEKQTMKTPVIIPTQKKEEVQPPLDIPKGPADSLLIKPLRTYEDDVKEAMQNQNASVARIVLSEQKKKEKIKVQETKRSIKSPVNMKKILIAILLVVLGGGISYGAYLWQKSRPIETKVALIRPPIIETNSQIEVIAGDKNKSEVIAKMRQALDSRFTPENIREIFLTKTVEVETAKGIETKKAALNTEDFFYFIGAIPPGRLTRSLNKEFLLGTYSLPEENDPFILFKVDDYENAFISMLEWEKTLVRDITPIFYKNFEAINPNDIPEEAVEVTDTASTTDEISTTTDATADTSTTTPETSTEDIATSTESVAVELPNYDPRDFKDAVLNNRDIRFIENSEGKTLFFYTFIDKNTLLMTTTDQTLDEVIKRLRAARLIR